MSFPSGDRKLFSWEFRSNFETSHFKFAGGVTSKIGIEDTLKNTVKLWILLSSFFWGHNWKEGDALTSWRCFWMDCWFWLVSSTTPYSADLVTLSSQESCSLLLGATDPWPPAVRRTTMEHVLQIESACFIISCRYFSELNQLLFCFPPCMMTNERRVLSMSHFQSLSRHLFSLLKTMLLGPAKTARSLCKTRWPRRFLVLLPKVTLFPPW